MKSSLSFLLLSTLVACADKPAVDPSALDAIDVNETGKDDSFRRPTVKGSIGMREVRADRVTRTRAFHAYNFAYEGEAALVRYDLRSHVGEDMFFVAYRRAGNFWVLADYNDDCGDGSLNSCLMLPSTSGEYLLVATTYDAMLGSPIGADYELEVSCKDGGCLTAAHCGGFAGLACPDGQYCNFAPEQTCGAADQMGTCAPIPDICTKEFSPVCGCDGNTYGNACEAAAAGTSVVREGTCEVACGARLGDTCAEDEYCKFDLGAICGFADATGVCAPRPQFCTQQFDPVCGCDGETYSNECTAAAADVGIQAVGACP